MKKLFQSVVAVVLGTISSHAQTAINAASMPLYFEAGQGQGGITTPFAAHGPNSEFLLAETNVQFVLRKPSGETAFASMNFLGANPKATITGETELPGKLNYFLGNDPTRWQSGISEFARVKVENVYPGINVSYYGTGRQLEYDFELASGVDPKTIAIRFDGAKNVTVNPQGELLVNFDNGNVIQHQPVVYQGTGANRHEISGGYQILDSHTATFALGSYDHSLPLIIDPILGFSAYFGAFSGDTIRAITRGNDGSIYIAGNTLSAIVTNAIGGNTTSGYITNFQGGIQFGDAFVAKFDKNGVNQYFTYLGGNQDDNANAIAVDANNNAYITGFTDSPNFPHSTTAYQKSIAGVYNVPAGAYPADAFVTEINAAGSNIIYSTFLGGSQADAGNSIAVDANGYAYVVGRTFSQDFPTTNHPYQPTLQCPFTKFYNCNAFLAEISPGGTSLTYSSYFGGTNIDGANGVALNPTDNSIFITGYTLSTNFPVINGPTGTNASLNTLNNLPITTNVVNFDAFVSKFAPGFAGSPIYSTFLGGSSYDIGVGIAADTSGNAYVVGTTSSTNFPIQTPGYSYLTNLSCVQTNILSIAAATNTFLTKVTWNGANVNIGYSIVIGGDGEDVAGGVALDASGNAYIVGAASSENFPVTTNNLFGSLSATNTATLGYSDVFVTAFAPNASLIYSGYLGGSLNNFGLGITVNPTNGDAYIAGQTSSLDFPTFNASQTNLIGSYNGFIAKMLMSTPQPALKETVSGTNLLLSWQSSSSVQETPSYVLLESNTNLLFSNSWTAVTNSPVTNNGTYIYTLPLSYPVTNFLPKFFRLQMY